MGAGGNGSDPRCGDFGGVNQKGGPCGLVAGFNTDHLGDGPCASHDTAKAESQKVLKKAFLDHLREQPAKFVEMVAREVGTSFPVMWRQLRDDDEFHEEYDGIMADRKQMQVNLVEESQVSRIIAGKAAPTLEIWWEKKNNRENCPPEVIEIHGVGGRDLIPIQLLRQMEDRLNGADES